MPGSTSLSTAASASEPFPFSAEQLASSRGSSPSRSASGTSSAGHSQTAQSDMEHIPSSGQKGHSHRSATLKWRKKGVATSLEASGASLAAARAREVASQVVEEEEKEEEGSIDGDEAAAGGDAVVSEAPPFFALVLAKWSHRFSRRLRKFVTLSLRGLELPKLPELARNSAAKASTTARKMPTRRSDDDDDDAFFDVDGFFILFAAACSFGPPPLPPPLAALRGNAVMRWPGVG